MPYSSKLSVIESEARRLVRRLAAQRLRALQDRLARLCDERWEEIRGDEPATPLARILWQTSPPLAHLFAELYDAGDPRLGAALGDLSAAQGMALLVLAQIERGDADAVHTAYDAMRHFEVGVAQAYIEGVKKTARWISGQAGPEGAPGARPKHGTPLRRALAAIITELGRGDWKAVREVIGFLCGTGAAGADPQAERLLSALEGLGLAFRQVERNRVRYESRGAAKSTTTEHLAEMLAEVRAFDNR